MMRSHYLECRQMVGNHNYMECRTFLCAIKRSEVQLKKGEFLDAELIGMKVYEDFIHRYVGTVEEVLTYPAHKL